MSEIYYITGSLFFPILNVFFDKNHRKTKQESRKIFPAFRYLNAGGKKRRARNSSPPPKNASSFRHFSVTGGRRQSGAAPGTVIHQQIRTAAIPDGNTVFLKFFHENDTVFLFNHHLHFLTAMLSHI
jgi:hypothetical protein